MASVGMFPGKKVLQYTPVEPLLSRRWESSRVKRITPSLERAYLQQESMESGDLMRSLDMVRSNFSSWQPAWKDEEVFTILVSPCFLAVDSRRGRRILVRTKWPTTLVAQIVSIPCGLNV